MPAFPAPPGAAPPTAGEPQALAGSVLTRVARRWDAAREPIALPALDAWLRLAQCLESPPDLPSLAATWAELLPAGAPDPADLAEVQRFTDWLILCRLLTHEQLAPLGWGPGQMQPIADFIDRVAADSPRLPPTRSFRRWRPRRDCSPSWPDARDC